MSNTTDSRTSAARTYGNWSVPRTPGLGRLGMGGTALLFVLLVTVMLVSITLGVLAGAVCTLAGALVLTPLLFENRDRRNGYATVAVRWTHRRNRRKRRDRYVPAVAAGPNQALFSAPNKLPGLLHDTQLVAGQDSHGLPFALVRMPQVGQWSVLLKCDPEGGQLVDVDTVDTWVAQWGAFLAELGHEPGLIGASVTVETAPDHGEKLAAEVDQLVTPTSPPLARAVLEEAVADWPGSSATVSTWVSLTWSQRAATAKRKTSAEEMLRQIGDRLPGLCQALSATGAGMVRAMTAAEVAAVAAVAYSPARRSRFSEPGESTTIPWSDAGPAGAMQDRWDHLLHDEHYSVVFKMTAAPTSPVPSRVLTSLVGAHAALSNKRVTLLYRPHTAAAAAAVADRDVRTAKTRATSRKGESKATETAALAQARQTAAEQAAGAGLVRFAMLVTVTVANRAQLDAAASVVDQLAGAARIRLHRATGVQAAGFVAGLGLGVVLADHVKIPVLLRDNL